MKNEDYPTLFDKQPKITAKLIKGLQDRKLLVPEKSLHKSERRTAQVTNPTAGEVIGYSLLAEKLKGGEISQDDARILLVLETVRVKGPRETHVARLVSKAFNGEKGRVLKSVEVSARVWAKKRA